MKKLFIIANWKSNKTIKETEKWFHDFDKEIKHNPFSLEDKEVIIAPSFTLLEHARYCSSNLKLHIKFGAQDISSFDEGAYTGEVSAKQIKELADYVIVGHSERRANFSESDEVVTQKIGQTFKHDLVPIVCISDIKQISNFKFQISNYQIIIAYEPLFAIGSGQPDTPANANDMAKKIKEVLGEIPVLYGGSVSPENVRSFTKMPSIDGVLVGGASLNPLEFLEIIKNA
jgi:triosephosphate isomerase